MLLLQKRYTAHNPHALQLVPDRTHGDLGLEAFSHDGSAYQCYAAEEPTGACYEKQRDKLTRDLGKLQSNSAQLKVMLGTVKFRTYVFMVHRSDDRLLIDHASTKTAEVLGWALDFIDPSFSIVVETLDSHIAEQKLIHALPAQLHLALFARRIRLRSCPYEHAGVVRNVGRPYWGHATARFDQERPLELTHWLDD
jgi:hypothetical protein